ncbi:MAG: hypothetical protein R3F05_09815 [Planctomycetota bacterium]
MHSSRRSCYGRAAVSWVPWLAVVLLAIFSLVQLRGRGKTDAPAAPPVESAAHAAAPAAAGTSTPATAEADLANALVLDEEFMDASQGLRKTREALEAEQRVLAQVRQENLRLAVERDAWRAAAEAAAQETPAADALPGAAIEATPAPSGELAQTQARVRELEAQLAEASGPVWKDLLSKDGKAKDAARTALRDDEAERAALREALGARDAAARSAARALFLGEDAPKDLVGAALSAAARAGDTSLLDALGADRALEPSAFHGLQGEEPATSTFLAWVAGRSATLTSEARERICKAIADAPRTWEGPAFDASDDRWPVELWLRVLARLDPAAALAAIATPLGPESPVQAVEVLARLADQPMPAGSGPLALQAMLHSDLAIRRAAAVVGRRVFGASFDIDPAADAATREKAVARLREGAPR